MHRTAEPYDKPCERPYKANCYKPDPSRMYNRYAGTILVLDSAGVPKDVCHFAIAVLTYGALSLSTIYGQRFQMAMFPTVVQNAC